MNFRTEIGKIKGSFHIDLSSKIVLLGSCFADNIGERLLRNGFSVTHNPLGPLFNPRSLSRIVLRGAKPYTSDDLTQYGDIYHCLDFANRFQNARPDALLRDVNALAVPLALAIESADVVILTLGTNKVFHFDGVPVGNCHKLPGSLFVQKDLSVLDCASDLRACVIKLIDGGKKVILTLSPVRYPGEGLPKGFLAKATLRLAIQHIVDELPCDYFPAFEIVNDDLRDYRFYADDLRHPSQFAVDYIYEKFCETYFTEPVRLKAAENYRQFLQSAHRPIINQS